MTEENTTNIEQAKPEKPTKNKWLFTTDNFGKLEKDIIYESKTYQSGIRESETAGFKIVTKHLKNKR